MRQRLAVLGQDVLLSTPDEFGVFLREESVKSRRTIEAAGVKLA
jgi:hypothetical protein